MAIPKTELCRAARLFSSYCEERTSRENETGARLLYIIKNEKIVLIESQIDSDHPSESIERPVAQFQYRETTGNWSLFGYNWGTKSLLHVKGHLEKLIQAMDEDLTGVFWTKLPD